MQCNKYSEDGGNIKKHFSLFAKRIKTIRLELATPTKSGKHGTYTQDGKRKTIRLDKIIKRNAPFNQGVFFALLCKLYEECQTTPPFFRYTKNCRVPSFSTVPNFISLNLGAKTCGLPSLLSEDNLTLFSFLF